MVDLCSLNRQVESESSSEDWSVKGGGTFSGHPWWDSPSSTLQHTSNSGPIVLLILVLSPGAWERVCLPASRT